jgi:hypothetical protein
VRERERERRERERERAGERASAAANQRLGSQAGNSFFRGGTSVPIIESAES